MDRKSCGARFPWLLVSAALLLLAVGTGGCKSDPENPFAAQDEKDAAAKVELAAQPAGEAPDTAGTRTAVDLAALQFDAWTEQAPPPFEVRDESFRHWRHRDVDPLIACPPARRPNLNAAVNSADELVSTNAAIVQAYWGTGLPVMRLADAVRSQTLGPRMRSAAAEALGSVHTPIADTKVRELLGEITPLSSVTGVSQVPAPPEVHAELLRALVRRPRMQVRGDDMHLNYALRSPAWNVRHEATVGWGKLRGEELPMACIDRRSDADPRVRAAALRTIAAHGGLHAIEYLQQGLSDGSFEVQKVATAALGSVQSEQAGGLLTKLANDRRELTRAAAVLAMAAGGIGKEIEAAAKDESQQVRLAVAQVLGDAKQTGQQIAAHAVNTANNLVRDTSKDVQLRAVASVENWPLSQAGPVLLLAMSEGSFEARSAAAAQLSRRWPAAADFPIDAPGSRREAALSELKQLWTAEYGQVAEQLAAVKAEAAELVALSADRVRDVYRYLAALREANMPAQVRREAIDALVAVGPALLPLLEVVLTEQTGIPPAVFEEVLPAISATFAILERMRASDVLARRTAAQEFAAHAVASRISPLAAQRLTALLEIERDPVVWKSALAAVANDASEQAAHLAYLAIGHAAVDVRRAACDYLCGHGHPRHAPVLLPALHDADATVVLAAVRALGAVGTLADPQPLIQMLNVPDKKLRLEAAISLAKLRFAQGVSSLERLALDTDLEIRIRTAQAMGEIGDAAFLPALMVMLADAKADVPRVAMISLTRIAGTDVAASTDGTPLPQDEQIRRWQIWYRDRQERLTAR